MSTSTMSNALAVFHSELGWMAMIGSGRVLRQLAFGHPSPDEAVRALEPSLVESTQGRSWNCPFVERLQAYAAGKPVELLDIEIDLTGQSKFRRQVYRFCRQIPPGKTITYGQLAARAGSPGAARAVGGCMAANRVPIVVPCHRVVASGGGLGGFSGPGGISLKRRLLDLEARQHASLGRLD
jgi:methylated-DNA-[protein]-cysteine S-methyltransferase